jgi:uncharacterized protein (TIGR02001 family)
MKNFLKKVGVLAVTTSSLIHHAYAAEASATIGVGSNYIFRGITQTADQTAVSGSLDYSFDSGAYVGTWVSNVDFGGGGQTEIDYYAGYSGKENDISYDIGYAYYHYPEAEDTLGSDFSFGEIYGSISYKFLTAGIYYVTNSETDDTRAAEAYIKGDTYYYLNGEWEIDNDWTIGITLGKQTFSDDGVSGTELDYTNALLDVTKSSEGYGDFIFSISKSSNATGLGNDDNLIPVISWSKGF